MGTSRHTFNAKINRIVKSGVLSRVHKSELLEDGITIAGSVEKQLCSAVEGDQEVLVVRMARIDESAKRRPRFRDLAAAH